MHSTLYLRDITLSKLEEEFVSILRKDLISFNKGDHKKCALVFPSLHKRYRFLIHKVVELFPKLNSFSIGEGWYRRTVIHFLRDYHSEELRCCKVPRINMENNLQLDSQNHMKNDSDGKRNRNKGKRPDLQLYVPRGRRNKVPSSPNAIGESLEGKISCKDYDGEESILHHDSLNDDIEVIDHSSKTENGLANVELASTESAGDSDLQNFEKSNPNEFDVQKPSMDSYAFKDGDHISQSTENVSVDKKECNDTNYLSQLGMETNTSSQFSDRTSDYKEINPKVNVQNVNYNGNVNHSIPSLNQDKGECIDDHVIDEDTWDVLFDDSGDCLNPEQMKEIDKKLGKVTLKKSKINYLEFTPAEMDLDSNEFNHIIELYNFPMEFKTQDLIMAFAQFKDKGFDIKWVDDTHALAVFANANAASAALMLKHATIKSRPLSEGTEKSKQKAKHCSEFLQPYKPRPETSAALARRLVTGALGLQMKVPNKKREEEKKKLQEARAKKKQTAKQKKDIWDGKF